MLSPDVILKAGGPDPDNTNAPSKRAQVYNLASDATEWSDVPDMSAARKDMYLVAMPDGTALALGGPADTPAEAYDPVANSWITLAANPLPKTYHSSAVLLPSGATFPGGGDDFTYSDPNIIRSYQIYKPRYMFWSGRPQFDPNWSPPGMNYGDPYDISRPDAAEITKVRLIRLGAATHSFDHDQRMIELSFSVRNSTTVRAAAPANQNVAPPGYYLLFICKDKVSGDGGKFPSEGRFVQLLP